MGILCFHIDWLAKLGGAGGVCFKEMDDGLDFLIILDFDYYSIAENHFGFLCLQINVG